MISFVLFSLTRAWQGFWRNAVMSLAATATMVLMLLLLAGFWIIQTGPARRPPVHRAEGRGRRLPAAERHRQPGRRRCRPSSRRCPRSRRSPTSSATRRSSASARRWQAQGREDLTRYLDAQPALREPRGQAGRPDAGPARSATRCARDPSVAQRHQHRGPRRTGPDRHQHPAHGRHGRARRRRDHRPVHHHQHDPPGGPRPRRGDRGHAPGRRVGRVHPLAVRVRGRLRRASSARC